MLRYHPDGVVTIDIKPGAEPPEATVTLRRGATLRARVRMPDGKPAEKFIALSPSYIPDGIQLWQWVRHNASKLECRGGELLLPGCDPEKGGSVWLYDAGHALGATLNFTGAEASGPPLTVTLQPCGSATMRTVDAKGEPFSPMLSIVFSPGAIGTLMGQVSPKDGKALEGDAHAWAIYDSARPNPAGADTFMAPRPSSATPGPLQPHPAGADTKEWTTFTHLIPGAPYQLAKFGFDEEQGWPRMEFRVKPGETVKLPDFDR
jgi:hypothetical protein